MKKTSFWIHIATIFFLLFLVCGCTSLVRMKHSAQGVSKVTVDELLSLINGNDITVLDVRDAPDWDKSEYKIIGAIREDPTKTAQWAPKYNIDQPLIVYCA